MSRRPVVRFAVLAGVLLALSVVTYYAVHGDGLFELGDGTGAPGTADILADTTAPLQPGPDWEDLFNADGSMKDTDDDGDPDFHEIHGGVAASFIADDLSQAGQVDDTIFSQSNKNNHLIGTWNWDTGNNPPKDDLVNVYSFARLNAFNELIIYAGLERLAEEGDSHVDFEFNQSDVGLDKAVPCGDDGTGGAGDGSPCEFTGEKLVNDLLVVMDFQNGGRLGFVEVRRWDGADYVLIEALGGEGCTADDAICAFNNNVEVDGGPWTNYNRSGDVVTNLPPNGFTELGINVTKLFGLTPCFGTIQSKTRSSQSFTSELKDFAFGGFDVCGVSVDKTGPALSKIGDDVTYTYSVTNEGAVSLALVSALDDKVGDLTAAADAAGCDPLDPGEVCTFTADFTIPGGAEDPYVNVITVEFDPDGGGSAANLTAEDDHSINLFQPGVEVTKTGDARSKAGDPVNYRIDIVNTGSADSPDLVNGTIVDTLLGDLLDPANPYVTARTCTATLPTGGSCSIDATRTVLATDPDPLPNTVTVHYNPDGFPNDISDSDDHSVDLFQPSVRVEKTGDTLSKAGDPVSYRFTVTNTSSADSPSLINGTIVDSLLGDLLDPANPYVVSNGCGASLAPGASCEILAMRTVEASDPDPLPNTVTVTYQVEGFPNTVSHSDGHSVNLFQPCVDVVKNGDTLGKIGDPVDYTIMVTNCSSADSPDLVNGTIVDTLLGDLLAANAFVTAGTCAATLPTGGSCSISATRTVLATDPDPLPNTVTVHYNPDGFPNDISDSDSHEVELFQPSVTIDKTGDGLSKVGDPVNYVITVTNTSSADSPSISCTLTDALLGLDASFGLAPGASQVTNASRTVEASDPDPLVNTASVTCTVDGFGNVLGPVTDTHSVNLFQPCVDVVKSGDTLSKAGDAVNYTIAVTNCSSADSPDLVNGTIVDSLLGDLLAANAFVTASTCAETLPTGGSCSIAATRTVLATDPDPLPNTVTVHYNPDGFPNDISDSDSHSVDLVHPDYNLDKLCAPATVTVGSLVTYNIVIANTGDVTLNRISVSDSLLGDVTASFPATLTPGASATVTLTRTVQSTDPDILVNTITSIYQVDGLPNQLTREDSCSVEIQRGCALSPGFWGGGSGRLLWDQSTDLLGGQPVPFTTTTVFPWLAPNLAGTTYLAVLNLPARGDVTIQLAFKYIAARLNEASSFGVPADVAVLLDAVDVYFMSNPVGSKPAGAAKDQGVALFNALNAYFATVGESDCPPISEF